MQAAAAAAAALIITAPQAEPPAPVTAPAPEVQMLPRRNDVSLGGIRGGEGPGEGCNSRHNSLAFMDVDGAVYLYMSTSEQLRRFGRIQEVYYPGDPGYALATSYADQGVVCGGSSVEGR